MNINIGIVTTWFERGAAYVSKQFKDSLEKNGAKVFIYARGGEKFAIGDSIWDTEEVTWGESEKKLGYPKGAIDNLHLLNWVKENNVSSVIFNEQTWNSNVTFLVKNNIKVGAYIDYYNENTVPLFGIYDFLICNTKRHLSAFTWHKQVYYLPWGTDIELFKPVSFENVSEKNVVFFHSAGFNPYRKGTDLLLKSFEQCIDGGELYIHSQVSLNEFFPDLNTTIEKLKKLNKLVVVEDTVTAPGLYYKGDVYVYPTRLEGIGLTIAEAVSSGLPTIVPDFPPMNEFINEKSGVTVDIDKLWCRGDGYYWPQCEVNLDDLTEKMNSFIINKGNLYEQKKMAREFAELNLNWNDNSKSLLAIINNSSILKLEDKSVVINKAEVYDNSNIIRQHWKDQLIEKYPFLKILKYKR
jgi:glycosyltransferase involved in cell wall biosynthesis